jgi:hypothetical protein
MDCYILIHKGEPELQRALEALTKAGINAIAMGWGSDLDPNLWPQVQIDINDFERAQTVLAAAGIDYGRLPLKESMLSGAAGVSHG